MNQKAIPDVHGFARRSDWLATFAGAPTSCELSGPGTLIRLVQFAKTTYDGLQVGNSRRDGAFWFAEDLLVRVRSEAKLELARQAAGRPFRTPMAELVGNYMRHVFRDALAVSKDWTNDFDGYLRMRLFPGDKLVALVGAVKRQPAYSEKHTQHEAVVAKDIWLEGLAKQYVIDFSLPENKAYAQRIQGPFEF